MNKAIEVVMPDPDPELVSEIWQRLYNALPEAERLEITELLENPE